MERQLKRITGLFLIIATIIVGSMVVTYWAGQIVISNSRTLVGRLEADNELQSFYNMLLEAESGQRGFLLTGDDKYLTRYHTSVEQIGNELDNIDELAKEGRIEGAIAGEIHNLTRRKLAEMEQTIDLWRKQG